MALAVVASTTGACGGQVHVGHGDSGDPDRAADAGIDGNLSEFWQGLQVPPGFAAVWDPSPSFQVVRSTQTGAYRTTLDWQSLAPPAVLTRYVDRAAGNDSNGGTSWGDAFRTVQAAVDSALADDGVNRIYVRAGTYGSTTGWHSGRVKHDLAIIAEGGTVVLSSQVEGAAWTPSGSSPGVYELAVVGASHAVDLADSPSTGSARLKAAASLKDCASTAGSWFYSEGVMSVHRTDGSPPDSNVLVFIPPSTAVLAAAGPIRYFEGIEFRAMGGSDSWASTEQGTAVFVDCAFTYAKDNGLAVDGVDKALLLRANAYDNGDDGLNYHDTQGRGLVVLEEGCLAHDNGTDQIDNASTIHEDGTAIIQVAGTYLRQPGPVIHDIGAGVSWLVGCSSTEPMSSPASEAAVSFESARDGMWLDGCTASGAYSWDLYGAGSGMIRFDPSTLVQSMTGSVSLEPETDLTDEQRLVAYFAKHGGIYLDGDPGAANGGVVEPSRLWKRATQPPTGSWTAGSGWMGSGDTYAHTPGVGSEVSRECLAVGSRYAVPVTVSITAGAVTPKAGATVGEPITSSGAHVVDLECTDNPTLAFLASPDSDATVKFASPVDLSLEYLVPRVATGMWKDLVPNRLVEAQRGWQLLDPGSGRNAIRMYDDVYLVGSSSSPHATFLSDGTGGFIVFAAVFDDLSTSPECAASGGFSATSSGSCYALGRTARCSEG